MCEYKNYEIYKVYKDVEISAKTGNKRTAFEELKEDIFNKKCNTIVVLKLDRLTRSVYDWKNIMKFLEENNACLNDSSNTTIFTGRLTLRIITGVSQNEIEKCSERTKLGMVGAIKDGHVPKYEKINSIIYIYSIDFINDRLVSNLSLLGSVFKASIMYFNACFLLF